MIKACPMKPNGPDEVFFVLCPWIESLARLQVIGSSHSESSEQSTHGNGHREVRRLPAFTQRARIWPRWRSACFGSVRMNSTFSFLSTGVFISFVFRKMSVEARTSNSTCMRASLVPSEICGICGNCREFAIWNVSNRYQCSKSRKRLDYDFIEFLQDVASIVTFVYHLGT